MILAGLPPFPGFLAKLAILAPLFAAGEGHLTATSWTVLAALVLSGFATIIAMTRSGIDAFWALPVEPPRVYLTEIAPIVFLLTLCAILTVQAGPSMRYMSATAEALHQPHAYVRGVLQPAGSLGAEDAVR